METWLLDQRDDDQLGKGLGLVALLQKLFDSHGLDEKQHKFLLKKVKKMADEHFFYQSYVAILFRQVEEIKADIREGKRTTAPGRLQMTSGKRGKRNPVIEPDLLNQTYVDLITKEGLPPEVAKKRCRVIFDLQSDEAARLQVERLNRKRDRSKSQTFSEQVWRMQKNNDAKVLNPQDLDRQQMNALIREGKS